MITKIENQQKEEIKKGKIKRWIKFTHLLEWIFIYTNSARMTIVISKGDVESSLNQWWTSLGMWSFQLTLPQ